MKSEKEDFQKFRILNKLKSIYRNNSVGTRKESSSEHSWSCLLLADMLLSKINSKIDRMRVYELLVYHDIIEIEIGDFPLKPDNNIKKNDTKEDISIEKIKNELPKVLGDKFFILYKEFKDRKTPEAKFAKLIDALDPILHELDYKEDWKTWTKDFFIKEKSKYFKDFPELYPLYDEIVNFLSENDYFKKEDYLVKYSEEENLPEVESEVFEENFRLFTAPFMDEKNLNNVLINKFAKRDNDKAVYVIKGKKENLYGGKLWEDSDVEMISNMDYMYCLPSWDWWINPTYDASLFRKEYLNHIPGKYGNTVIFVKNNKKRERDFKEILINEDYVILDIKRQYEKNNIEFFMFYDYWRIYLPSKLAREINRIKETIYKKNPSKLIFLLRSGFLIADLLDIRNISNEFIIPSSFNGNLEGNFIIDDCIVKARNINKIGLKRESKFHLSVIDCAVPKKLYLKEYFNCDIDAPKDLISTFSCRMFEKNPYLIGLDILNKKYIYYKNKVRDKFIDEIRVLMEKKDLNKYVHNMANDLLNYGKGGYNNICFDKLNILNENEN